jgi:hypothetical protein
MSTVLMPGARARIELEPRLTPGALMGAPLSFVYGEPHKDWMDRCGAGPVLCGPRTGRPPCGGLPAPCQGSWHSFPACRPFLACQHGLAVGCGLRPPPHTHPSPLAWSSSLGTRVTETYIHAGGRACTRFVKNAGHQVRELSAPPAPLPPTLPPLYVPSVPVASVVSCLP